MDKNIPVGIVDKVADVVVDVTGRINLPSIVVVVRIRRAKKKQFP